MSFLNNLGKKIGSAANSAADKAKRMAEIAKLNSAISAEEKQIQQRYLDIGKVMFEHEKDNPGSPIAEHCSKILESQASIEDLKEKIADLKADEKTEAPAAPEATPLETTAPPVTTVAANTCKNCSEEVPPTAKFCLNCGTPMKS